MKYFNSLFLALLVILSLAACNKADAPGPGDSRAISNTADGSGLSISGGGAGGGSSDPNNSNPLDSIPAGQITAGEWRDLDHWDFWQNLMVRTEYQDAEKLWEMYPKERYTVELVDQNGQALMDTKLELVDAAGNVSWEARTDNTGKAELWVDFFGPQSPVSHIQAYTGQVSKKLNNPKTADQGINYMALPVNAASYDDVDIFFAIDATGSMGDEMGYLQTEVKNVIQRAQQAAPGRQFRLGAVFYRDIGDDYLTRELPFTSSINSLANFIGQQDASGGGDFPEGVDAALEVAINQQIWSSQARCRIIFLLLDAPPHEDSNTRKRINNQIKEAARLGIRIVPISASGINKSTEFLMRYMGAATQGSYVFVTDHSGIGGDHLEATVGEYQVEFLNNLLVRLIAEFAQ